MTHTNGKWVAVKGNSAGMAVVAPDQPKVRYSVAACGGPNREANARLISAAPDLLEFAKAQEAWEADLIINGDWSNEMPRLTQAQYDRMIELQEVRRAAIAKAEATKQ